MLESTPGTVLSDRYRIIALGADYPSEAQPLLYLVVLALGEALPICAILWAAYLALEPYVRRRWPEALIGWNRMLAGRWKDPRVGRDVLLLGLMVGLASYGAWRASAGGAGQQRTSPRRASPL